MHPTTQRQLATHQVRAPTPLQNHLPIFISISRTAADIRTHCTDPPAAPYADVKAQKAFEKGLLEKTAKQTADIILYDNRIVLYKSESDIMMYVVGGVDENEIMLYNVILAMRDSLHLLFKYVSTSSFYYYYPDWIPANAQTPLGAE